MIRLDRIKRETKSNLNRTSLLNLSSLISVASSERYTEIKKMGKKLMKYLELKKCLKFNRLQKKGSPISGRNNTVKRIRAFLQYFETKGKRMNKMIETTMRGM
jgi:hypothetical protein